MQCIPSLKNKQGNSKPSVLTKSKVEIMRVKYEIKFLYKKKQQILNYIDILRMRANGTYIGHI
jgi:hypothetical protein